MTKNRIVAGLALLGCCMPVMAAADALNADQTKQVQGIVHSYLVENPGVVVESLQAWQQKQMSQSMKKTQASALQAADALFRAKGDPVTGNPNGRITVVEFFDYQCPHCVDMQPVFQEMLSKNPNIKLVFKEFPIRGPVSEVAARAAMAAEAQGKYMALHDALMKAAGKGPLTETMIYDLAGKAGLNVPALKKAAKSDHVKQLIQANFELAQKLDLRGTPAIFVADSSVSSSSSEDDIVFIPGQTDVARLNDAFAKVSKQ